MTNISKLTSTWATDKKITCQHFDELDSTSSFAKKTCFETSQSCRLILADNQTQGRGRSDHSWLSSPQSGSSLYSTWCFSTARTPSPILTARLGFVLFDALKKTWPSLPLSLKAPNDIFLNGKKILGLLIEVVDQGSQKEILVGLGLNVFQKPSLETAGCLTDFLSESEVIDSWNLFLSFLFDSMKLCIHHSQNLLSQNECEKLLKALNLNPHLTEKFIEVLPDGSIKNSTQTILWQDL